MSQFQQHKTVFSTPNTEPGTGTDQLQFFQPPVQGHQQQRQQQTMFETPPRATFPPTTPENPFAGPLKGIVPRDPEAEKRTRGHTAIVQEVLNSLMRRGEIVMYGPKQWRLNATVAVQANRAPNANDDSGDGYMVGQIWVNATTGDVYILASAAVGAADWRGPL